MEGGWTIGKYVLAVLAIIVFFPAIMGALKFVADLLDGVVSATNSQCTTTHPFASTLIDFFSNGYDWFKYVLTSSLAVATLIFISLIYHAFEAKWK